MVLEEDEESGVYNAEGRRLVRRPSLDAKSEYFKEGGVRGMLKKLEGQSKAVEKQKDPKYYFVEEGQNTSFFSQSSSANVCEEHDHFPESSFAVFGEIPSSYYISSTQNLASIAGSFPENIKLHIEEWADFSSVGVDETTTSSVNSNSFDGQRNHTVSESALLELQSFAYRSQKRGDEMRAWYPGLDSANSERPLCFDHGHPSEYFIDFTAAVSARNVVAPFPASISNPVVPPTVLRRRRSSMDSAGGISSRRAVSPGPSSGCSDSSWSSSSAGAVVETAQPQVSPQSWDEESATTHPSACAGWNSIGGNATNTVSGGRDGWNAGYKPVSNQTVETAIGRSPSALSRAASCAPSASSATRGGVFLTECDMLAAIFNPSLDPFAGRIGQQ